MKYFTGIATMMLLNDRSRLSFSRLFLALSLGALPPASAQDLRIDGTNANMVQIWAMAVNQQGTIAVTQMQDGKILLFNSKGVPLGSFGRRGEGPGEFRLLSQIPGGHLKLPHSWPGQTPPPDRRQDAGKLVG
jgi:hypothetical protein